MTNICKVFQLIWIFCVILYIYIVIIVFFLGANLISSMARVFASIVGGICSWQAFTYYLRTKYEDAAIKLYEKQNETQANVGSIGDKISESINTGDLVVFNRRCTLMKPCGAAACIGTKMASAQSRIIDYDHCGVIVVRKDGIPQILEANWSNGVVLRPYDQRVIRSMADTIIIRPFHFSRTEDIEVKANEFIDRLMKKDQLEKYCSFHTSFYRFRYLAERYRAEKLIPRDKSTATDVPINPSAAMAALFYQEVLRIFPSESDPGYKPAEDFLPSDLLSCRLRKGATRLPEVNVRTR